MAARVSAADTRSDAEKLDAYFNGEFDKLMKLPGFRFVMMHIREDPRWCNAQSSTVENVAAPNPESMLIHEGARRIGIRLLKQCQKSSPELWLRMLPEANSIHQSIANQSGEQK